MRNRTNIRGETLAETIIALSILAIGITVASTIMINSFRNLTNAKNRVIAVNLAREGIEAVRNIRDTNWLYYSGQRRQCWNHNPDNDPCDINNLTPILPGVYVVYKHESGAWFLAPADLDVNTDDDGDSIPDNDVDKVITQLSLVNITPEAQPDGDWDGDSTVNADDTDDDEDGIADDEDLFPLDPENDPENVVANVDMYNHMSIPNSFGGKWASTGFRRWIVVEYMENDPSFSGSSQIDEPNDAINSLAEWQDLDASDSTGLLNRMRITSVVAWTRGGAEHTAELTTIITDHLGREDLSS